MIEDLSWSGLVDYIQDDEIKGADVIVDIVTQKETLTKELKRLEGELNSVKMELNMCDQGVRHVLKYLNKKTPLIVTRNNFVVIVNSDDYYIEKNII